MYRDLTETFWWNNMKREIAQYVAQCLVCQQVKMEHQRQARFLQPLPIPERKWEDITMDFVMGLPRIPTGKDAIWVIVDQLTRSAHFLAIRVDFSSYTPHGFVFPQSTQQWGKRPLHIEERSFLINTFPYSSLGDVGFHGMQDPPFCGHYNPI